MKTRTAFVSNSSTSSFCLIGRLAAEGKDIADFDIKSCKGSPIVVGGRMEGGLDIFRLTRKMQAKIKSLDPQAAGKLSLYDAVFIDYDGYSGLIDGGQISGDQSYVVMYGDADQNSSDTDTLLENIESYED